MVEKYNCREWFRLQVDEKGNYRDDSCLLHFSDGVSICGYSSYDGDDTYGYCIDYRFWDDAISRVTKNRCCFFTILVCQEGVKLLSFKTGKDICIVEVLQKMVDIVITIKDSLNEFKFVPQGAMFWSDKPLVPDYIAPLWFRGKDKKLVKIEDVEEYIKRKRLEMDVAAFGD